MADQACSCFPGSQGVGQVAHALARLVHAAGRYDEQHAYLAQLSTGKLNACIQAVILVAR